MTISTRSHLKSTRTVRLRISTLCITAAICGVMGALFAGTAAAQERGPSQRVIVKWKPVEPRPSAMTPSATLANMQVRYGLGFTTISRTQNGAQVIRLNRRLSDSELADMVGRFKTDPAVEYAEEDRLVKPLFEPNDPRYREQWHYFEDIGGIRLPQAFDSSSGDGVRVAVLDTGYRPHADIAANLVTAGLLGPVAGYDFVSDSWVANDGNGRDSSALDPGDWTLDNECAPNEEGERSSWHGTHVAGTVVAGALNGNGGVGVAPFAKVVPVRVLGRCGGYTSDIADAIVWAAGGAVEGVPANAHPAHIINMSLGGTFSCGSDLQGAINFARSKGVVVVAAAGNENTTATGTAPASCVGVITVAATTRDGGKAFYSNFGDIVDIAAPGGDRRSGAANGVLSTANSGTTTPGSDTYASYHGTSMAAPHVAGVAALMLSRNRALTPAYLEQLLVASARPFPGLCYGCGRGILDAAAAVNAALGAANPLIFGIPVSGISGAAGQEKRFTFQGVGLLPNRVVTFLMQAGTGDADLYVRRGAPPSTTEFSCRSSNSAGNEVCAVATLAGSDLFHVMVRGKDAFADVQLVVF